MEFVCRLLLCTILPWDSMGFLLVLVGTYLSGALPSYPLWAHRSFDMTLLDIFKSTQVIDWISSYILPPTQQWEG